MRRRCRERVWSLPTENGNDAQVALWLRLSDTEVIPGARRARCT